MSQIPETFLQIMRNSYPSIQGNEIKILDDGWDHHVYVIDGKIAFRFPRTKDHGQKDEIETRFFETFASQSPVQVQNMQLFTDFKTGIRYQMYKFIQGERFTKDLAKTLSSEQLSSIAQSLGKFLTSLHSYPVSEARKLHMDEIVSALDYVDYWEYFLKKDVESNMFDYFSKEEQEWIRNIFHEYITTVRKQPYQLKVTHFDLLPEHILVDPSKHTLSGIIDFSLRISDPAYDFSYLDRYGEDFLNTVIENYSPQSSDLTFAIRRKFYAGRLGFSFLSQAMERDKDKVPVIIEQIHSYIAQH